MFANICTRAITGLCIFFAASVCDAGLYKTTVHSRANCMNNESITWWLNHPYKWRVVSIHKHTATNQVHMIDTGFQYKNRVAAIHWGEGVHAGFVVWGYHYLEDYHKRIPFDTTHAEGCNIIEGWD